MCCLEYVMIPEYKFALREDLKDNKEFLPTKAEPKATGWDVRAAMEDRKPLEIRPLEYVKIPLGIRGFCPEGYWYELKPRSSTFGKKSLHALYGTIDETYEGQLIFACQYIPVVNYYNWVYAGSPALYNGVTDWNDYCLKNKLAIDFGEAIGQIIPVKRQEAIMLEASNEELDAEYKNRNGSRGTGGFGSTG